MNELAERYSKYFISPLPYETLKYWNRTIAFGYKDASAKRIIDWRIIEELFLIANSTIKENPNEI